jgi:hypothetical protein
MVINGHMILKERYNITSIVKGGLGDLLNVEQVRIQGIIDHAWGIAGSICFNPWSYDLVIAL